MVQPLRRPSYTLRSCIESPNAENSSYNRKNVGTTFDGGPTICVSFVKGGKTQVGWSKKVSR